MMIRLLLPILLLNLSFSAWAQPGKYAYKLDIDTVAETGFYRIPLSPEVLSCVRDGAPDIRVFAMAGTEVPYVYRSEKEVMSTELFYPFTIVTNAAKNGKTELIIESPNKKSLDYIALITSNADVAKTAGISGSNDNKEWFAVKAPFQLAEQATDNDLESLYPLRFPLSNYKYYRVTINDSVTPPLNILRAGNFRTYTSSLNYRALAEPVVSSTDSAGMQYVRVSFPYTAWFDRLQISISKPAYFSREAKLCTKELNRKGKTTYVTQAYLTLKSGKSNSFVLPGYRIQEFYLVIPMGDDTPLAIESVQAFQYSRYLIAYLEKGQDYQLVFGEPDVPHPRYDLQRMEQDIPIELPQVKTAAFTPPPPQAVETEKGLNSLFTTVGLWLGIIAVALLLLFMTIKMLREMKQGTDA